ncbi:MAG: hypothetical protein KA248_01870 [Kiritimatiellae bacterium]|nr:hypothetical protein [Kiritimatiellia bacterium]
MKPYKDMTPAERVVYRISELRDLGLKLSRAGRKAGLHQRPPRGAVREEPAPYDKGARSAPG